MPVFSVIDLITLTHGGPQALGPAHEQQLVFLKQGDADGACGPYSLLMALMICGLIDRDNILFFAQLDRRTNYGKLMARLNEHPGLFVNGTSLDNLVAIITGIFARRLCFEQCNENGTRVREFAYQHVAAGHPVILGLEFVDGAHWVVVVGVEYHADDTVNRLLLLDPGGPAPKGYAWNGAISYHGGGGRYPYEYWWPGDSTPDRVCLNHGLALWPHGIDTSA